MQGYAGKMIRIDLSDRSVETLDTDPDLARRYLGGSGFCTALLKDLDWNVEP